jgi:quercetin dioxygenase-like cupin family protein
VEIRRFGIGHRRPDGPPGTHGVEATPLHGDERGVLAELALKPKASIAPHANPNLAYFVVIEGGGFVQVGDERARVAAGDAVVWPPNVVHGAWTELTPMRAIVVEFAAADDAAVPLLTSGRQAEAGGTAEPAAGDAAEPPIDPRADALRADGVLAPKPEGPSPDRDSPGGEPW